MTGKYRLKDLKSMNSTVASMISISPDHSALYPDTRIGVPAAVFIDLSRLNVGLDQYGGINVSEYEIDIVGNIAVRVSLDIIKIIASH